MIAIEPLYVLSAIVGKRRWFDALGAAIGRSAARLALVAACLLAALGPVAAATLLVGPDQTLKAPSAAAAIAADGDTVEIEPEAGGYFDCAIWKASKLTIEGKGDGVVITDTTCQGKALFVTVGNDITIRNLTFQRARVPDKNGAGIRAEGRNLTIEHSRFLNNEAGILAGASPGSTIAIRDSEFADDGRCSPCSNSVNVGDILALDIERSRLRASKGGHYVHSAALTTTLADDEIGDGPDGASTYLVLLPDGGSLTMRDNSLERGPHSASGLAAIAILAGNGAHPVASLTFTGNRFKDETGGTGLFVQNWTGTAAHLENNALEPGTVAVSSVGYRWFRTKSMAHAVLGEGRGMLSSAKSRLKSSAKSLLGRQP